MAQGLFIGSGNIAKKAIHAYIGVNGVAKKIKKIYIGDANGKARVANYFDVSKLEKYTGTIASLTAPSSGAYRRGMSAATTSDGSKAVYVGGQQNSGYCNAMDVYNTSLTKSTKTGALYAYADCGVANVGDKIVLLGGETTNVYASNVIRTIDNNAETITSVGTLPSGAFNIRAINLNKNLAIFGGGNGDNGASSAIYSINNGLTVNPLSAASSAGSLEGTSVGGYAIFVYDSVLSVYNTSGTKVSTSARLSASRRDPVGASTGNYALFAGGFDLTSYIASPVVDAFNSNLTVTPLSLSIGKMNFAGYSNNNVAYYIGGRANDSSTVYDDIESFNSSLVRQMEPVKVHRKGTNFKPTKVGDYILVSGGQNPWVSAAPDTNTSVSAFKQI